MVRLRAHELRRFLELGGGRLGRVRQEPRPPDLELRILPRFAPDPAREEGRLGRREPAVHEHERLGRHRRGAPELAVRLHDGGVEHVEHRERAAPPHLDVEAPPELLPVHREDGPGPPGVEVVLPDHELPDLVRHDGDRRAEHPDVEFARDGERRVADHLRLEPPHVHPRGETVVRVDPLALGIAARGLPVGGGEHEHLVEALQLPSVFREVTGQPVQEIRVGGPEAEPAEVRRGRDQARSKMVHPDAVDEDARNERVGPVGQPAGVGEPAARGGNARVVLRKRLRGQHAEAGRGDLFLRLSVVAAVEDVRGGDPARHLHERPEVFLLRLFRADLRGARGDLLEVVGGLPVVEVERPGGDVQAGMRLEELFLFDGALRAGRLPRGAGLLVHLLGELRDLLLERPVDVLGLLALPFRVDLGGLLLDLRRLAPVLVGVERDAPVLGDAPLRAVERRLEDGPEPVVIRLRDRVVAVVVAPRAGDGQAQQGRGNDLDRIGYGLVAREPRVGPRGGGRPVRRHAQEAGGGQTVDVLRRQVAVRRLDHLVARQLLADEPVERLVGVERADHVIAVPVGVLPHRVLLVVSLRVGVARDVEPVAAPPLAVVGGGEEAVDQSFVGVRSGVGQEPLQFPGARREADQVEEGAPRQRPLVRIGREGEPLLRHAVEEERIDWRADAGRVLGLRHGGLPDRLERPERPLFGTDLPGGRGLLGLDPRRGGAAVDPAGNELERFLGDGVLVVGRHLAFGDPLVEKARGVLPGDDGGARLAALDHEPAQPQIQFRLQMLRLLAVALETMGFEDGTDVPLVRDRRVRPDRVVAADGSRERQEGGAEEKEPHRVERPGIPSRSYYKVHPQGARGAPGVPRLETNLVRS